MKKVIFMGTPTYADAILAKLIDTDDIEVVAVYTQPDKPVGRKKVLTPPVVKVRALECNIPVYQPIKLREESVVSEILEIECDYIVVAAYGQILPKAILDHAPCINLHASILPQYRGASPIQQTLLNGDKQTGVTAMLMEEGLDTGDILKIEIIDVDEDEMLEGLFDKLTQLAAKLTVDVLENFTSLTPQKQDNTKASYCKKITKADGLISFDANAREIYNKYRAFTPWPGIYLESGLKIKSMKRSKQSFHGKVGEIVAIEKEFIVVTCKEGSVEIFNVQPQSKKEMSVISYINGKRLQIADILL